MKKSIVLIHGWGGFTREQNLLIKPLEKMGFKVHVFKYQDKWGKNKLNKIVREFNQFSKKIKDNFTLIGLSQGGLIASYWLENYKQKKCRKCLTISTPFHGTLWAYLLNLPGIKQMRYNSVFLRKLRNQIIKSGFKYYHIWNPFDTTIIPGKSSKIENGENKTIYAPLHFSTFWAKPTLEFIEHIFK